MASRSLTYSAFTFWDTAAMVKKKKKKIKTIMLETFGEKGTVNSQTDK